MTPGDRPALPLAAEPFVQLVAPRTGTVTPGGPVPADGPFALGEEPALWPRLDLGAGSGGRAGDAASASGGSQSTGRAAGRLAATGLPGAPAFGLGLLALAALVRLRRRGL